MTHPLEATGVIQLLYAEYDRAKAKHGENTLDGPLSSDLKRLAAFMEEVGEVAELFTYDKSAHVHGEADWRKLLKKELIQAGNVTLTWASSL